MFLDKQTMKLMSIMHIIALIGLTIVMLVYEYCWLNMLVLNVAWWICAICLGYLIGEIRKNKY